MLLMCVHPDSQTYAACCMAPVLCQQPLPASQDILLEKGLLLKLSANAQDYAKYSPGPGLFSLLIGLLGAPKPHAGEDLQAAYLLAQVAHTFLHQGLDLCRWIRARTDRRAMQAYPCSALQAANMQASISGTLCACMQAD